MNSVGSVRRDVPRPLVTAGLLEVSGATVRFGGLTAIRDVHLQLTREEVHGLIGPNGAGKTTLVNVMSGFQPLSEGTILIDGETAAGWTPERFRRRGVARTFQAGRLFRDLTVSENVEVAAVNLGLSRRRAAEHARHLLNWVGIGDKAGRGAATLTYTDERRLGVARALARNPSFILLDEPAAGMTELECEEIVQVIAGIPKAFGCGVLLIEHNMRVVMGISSKIHVLDGGRCIASGSPSEVRSNPEVIKAYLGTSQSGMPPGVS